MLYGSSTVLQASFGTYDRGLLKTIVPFLQTLQCPPSIFRKVGPPIRHERFGEKTWLPFRAFVFPRRGFLTLLFLEFLFQLRGLAELLVLNGFGDAVPEAAALIAELLAFGRDDLGSGP